jgi:hypothetical protein
MTMEALPQDLADFLVTRNFDPEYFDEQGQPAEAGDAKTMKFDYIAGTGKNYGTAVCVVADNELSFFYGDNLGRGMEPEDKDEWYSFLEQLSNHAASHSATWSPTDINQLKHTLAGIAAIKEGLFEGYYGNRKVSYMGEQTQARLVINHNRTLGEDDKRYRYVESLFIETADQERFRLPFKSLSGGRAMLEHVRQGGRPYDVRGNHITEVVSEMAVLSRFNRAQHNRVFEGVTQELVESARQYYHNLQETVKHLGSSRGYQAYFESWAPDHVGEAESLVENLRNMFVEQTLDARIEAALPTLAKIQQQGINMKEAEIFESWINQLSEGTWALPETPEQMEKLNQLMSNELIVGPDATNATELLNDIVGDKELFDILEDLANNDPRANIWDDSDVQRRLAELGVQTPQSTEAEPADVAQDTAPAVKEGINPNELLGSVYDLKNRYLGTWDGQRLVIDPSVWKKWKDENGQDWASGMVGMAKDRIASGVWTVQQEQQGMAEGQLDEIGDTPAGRAALQKYQDKAGNQVAAHWKQVHNKSHLPTDEKMAKRNAGTVAAGNRIHGFGIAKNQQDKVTGRFDYRDAVGRTHVYQKNDPSEQGVAEGDNTSTFVEDAELAEMLKYAGVPIKEGVLNDDTRNTWDHLLDRFRHEVEQFKQGGDIDSDLYDAVFDYYDQHGAMPYRVRNAKDGTANQWISDRLADDLGIKENLISPMIMPVSEGSCNMTMEGEYCPEHGLMECGSMYEDGGAVGMPYSMGEGVAEANFLDTLPGSHRDPESWEMRNKEFDGLGGQGYPEQNNDLYSTGRAAPSYIKQQLKARREKGGVAGPKGHLPEQGSMGEEMDEAMFPGSAIGDKLRAAKDSIGRGAGEALKGAMIAAPGAGAGASAGAAMSAGASSALFAPALGAGALGGAAAALGGFLTYKGLNWLAQKLFGTKEEALQFANAHLKAASSGQPQFEFQGKTYPVKIKSPQEAQQLIGKIRDLQSQLGEDHVFDKPKHDDAINSNSAMTGSYYEGKETKTQEGDALLARIKSLALLR